MSRWLLLFAVLFTLVACSGLDVHTRRGPGWYLVKPTDTLYSIAWRYGLDYRELARWNGLSEPYQVQPGEQLLLIEPDKLPPPPQAEVTETGHIPPKVVVKTLTPDYNRVVRWRWPTQGMVINHFSNNELGNRGIDIAGSAGQPVYSVADGKVVYSGNGLADYGDLIIVKHNETFLSAYAFNSKRLVAEGASVNQGEQIAEMGYGKDKKPLLHFQIRKEGRPVDPEDYLPELK
jgi:lipoprotein NlpD